MARICLFSTASPAYASWSPGYYGTYWVKHLNEITVIDNVFEGFWMNPPNRISGHAQQQRSNWGTPRRKADDPDQPFHGCAPFITNVADGAKVKPRATPR